MIYFLRALARNLAAGLRLATLFPRVERASFRFDLAQLIALTVVSALIDIVTDWLGADAQAVFSWAGLQGEVYAFGLMLLTSALLAALWRDARLFVALPIMVMAGVIVVQIVHGLPLAWPDALSEDAENDFDLAVGVWMALMCMRAVYIAAAAPRLHRALRAFAGGLLLVMPLWFAPLLGPEEGWWSDESAPADENAAPSPASEPVLAAQQFLLDHALDELEDQRDGITDLYFVAFAPDSRRDGFRLDVEAAQQVMDEHWGTSGRSMVLVNSPRTVAEYPFATITHLNKTLGELGDIIDPDNDVVMIYLAGSATSDHALNAVHPPLDLVSLTPAGLKQLLDSAGIRYRVIVVSACYSGAWIDALKDDSTAIVASSAADAHDPGCDGSDERTRFGAAFFDRGMARVGNLEQALAQAQAALGEQGVHAVASVGSAIKPKLEGLGQRNGGPKTLARHQHRMARPA